MSYNVPILFIIFNRIETTKLVFEAIRLIQPSKLFIAADGARSYKNGEFERCNEVRDYVLNKIDWPCEVKTQFSDVNLGCGYGPKSAINWFFEHVEEGIILEDDCVPDLSFFQYCSELLEKYRYDNRISIISGSNMDRTGKYIKDNEDYFFSVIPYTWGWATWKRNWMKYDYEIKYWGKVNKMRFLIFLFQDREYRLYWKKIFDDIYNNVPADIWDYQFFFSCFLNNQLAIVPKSNLISNIGYDELATHTFNSESDQAFVPINSLVFPIIHPQTIHRNIEYDIFLQELCYGRIEYVTYWKRLKRFIKSKILRLNIK